MCVVWVRGSTVKQTPGYCAVPWPGEHFLASFNSIMKAWIARTPSDSGPRQSSHTHTHLQSTFTSPFHSIEWANAWKCSQNKCLSPLPSRLAIEKEREEDWPHSPDAPPHSHAHPFQLPFSFPSGAFYRDIVFKRDLLLLKPIRTHKHEEMINIASHVMLFSSSQTNSRLREFPYDHSLIKSLIKKRIVMANNMLVVKQVGQRAELMRVCLIEGLRAAGYCCAKSK